MTTSSNARSRSKLRLLSRDNLDRRTVAARNFDSIASDIAADLGGEDQLSTVQRHLVQAFAGTALHVHDLNARLLLGEKVDVVEHCQTISTLVRVAQRIGIRRVARDIRLQTLSQYLADKASEQSDDVVDGDAADS
jgi:hypothetical protein